MRTTALIAIGFALATAQAEAQTADPLSGHNHHMFAGIRTLLVRSAEKMPEDKYAYKPTEAVRTFGQIIGHVSDWQYTYCSLVRGEKRPAVAIEKTKSTKAELVAALHEALAYCEPVYSALNDANAADIIKLGTHTMPKIGVLQVNVIHATEHYGNLVTYLRMNGIVPPSSEPGFSVPAPRK
jgi:uncharacterized damage-inducible protein DinB